MLFQQKADVFLQQFRHVATFLRGYGCFQRIQQRHIIAEAFAEFGITARRFQYVADELKSLLGTDDVQFAELTPLCANLHSIYGNIMDDCWGAFVCNPEIDGEPGRFVIQQMVSVDSYEKRVGVYKNGF